ncbi:hypothetical protein vBCtySFA67_00083 [Clostridium phage vB_CtyS-FA67]|nr:hypothetical protein vBCtySFA67_00083 [Clostridium phage vB_CtyS-FA67]
MYKLKEVLLNTNVLEEVNQFLGRELPITYMEGMEAILKVVKGVKENNTHTEIVNVYWENTLHYSNNTNCYLLESRLFNKDDSMKDSLLLLLKGDKLSIDTEYKEDIWEYTNDWNVVGKMEIKWQSFGDVNFIEYGGTWIKRVGNCEYMVVKLTPLDDSDNEWIFEAGTIYTDDVWVKKEEIRRYQGVTCETDSVEYAEGCVSYYGLQQFGGNLKRSDDIVGLLQELKDYEILTPIEVASQMIEHLEGDKLEDNRHELLELLKEVKE